MTDENSDIAVETQPHHVLSERELTVLVELGQGLTVKQIATNHLLSFKTVSTYRVRAMEKMRLSSNYEIILYCIVSKLVALPELHSFNRG